MEDVGEALPQQRAGARAGHLGPLGIISGGRGHGQCPPSLFPLDHPPLELRDPL